MCGRFSLGADTDRLIAEFGPLDIPEDHAPRYNIAPTQRVLAVVRADDRLRAGWLRWGLIPTGTSRVPDRPLINARAETVERLPSFAGSFRRRRCWVLADGFYEWRRDPDGRKIPCHIRRRDRRPFAFAALWDRAEGAEGPVATCALLTTRPAPAVAEVHDRMPVMLSPGERDAWLDHGTDRATVERLLEPSAEDLEVLEVTSRVNSVRNDDPACIAPARPSH